jgi:hypothetical protein
LFAKNIGGALTIRRYKMSPARRFRQAGFLFKNAACLRSPELLNYLYE